MPLYLVVKTVEAYVQADSEQDAKWVRIDEDGSDVLHTATLVDSTEHIPRAWLEVGPFKHWSDKSVELTIEQLLTAPKEIPSASQ